MTLRSTTLTPDGRRIRSKATTVVLAFLGVMVIVWVVLRFGSNEIGAGPDGSVLVTDVNGSAGLFELLAERGVTAVPQMVGFDDLSGLSTVVILDPLPSEELGQPEAEALERFVRAGGRLVLSGYRPHSLIGTLLPEDIRFGYRGDPRAPVRFPLGGVGGSISTDGVRSIQTDAPHLPLAGRPAMAAAFELGRGTVIYVSDGSVFHNRRLVDNAAWILSILGEGPVVFDELRHGFALPTEGTAPTGITAALPDQVRATLWLLALAGLVVGSVYARRRQPVETTIRELKPPRTALVDATAGLLLRTKIPLDAIDPIVHRTQVLLRRRLGIAEHQQIDVDEAAKSSGLNAAEIAIALHPKTEEHAMVAHKVMTALNERNTR